MAFASFYWDYWAHLMQFRFRVDGGKPPGIRLKGNARRCRVLLSHPSSTILDLRLFSQVEVCRVPKIKSEKY